MYYGHKGYREDAAVIDQVEGTIGKLIVLTRAELIGKEYSQVDGEQTEKSETLPRHRAYELEISGNKVFDSVIPYAVNKQVFAK